MYPYPEDQRKIQQALMDYGVHKTLDECRELWEIYSEDMFAGWMTLPNDSESIFKILEDYLSLDNV